MTEQTPAVFKSQLAKINDTYMPQIESQLNGNGINMTEYQRTCVINSISSINELLMKEGIAVKDIDQSNLTRIVVMCQATKKTTFDNWKFYTKEGSEKYESLTLLDMMKMAEIMEKQTAKSMATETLLSHNLENLTEEELKNYNVKERYEKAYGEMR